MFLGHFGVAFAAKTAAPKVSLGSLFLAAQFVDLLWPILILAGLERVSITPETAKTFPLRFDYYPISHSLVAVFIWGALFGGIYLLLHQWPRGALVLGTLVVSHWFLDAIVHRPDLPLFPGNEQYVGLGLWSSRIETVVVELVIFAFGVCLYLRTTKPLDFQGRWAVWVLILTLLGIFGGNLFGPPPPSVNALALMGEFQWLLIVAGYWVDRHRVAIGRNLFLIQPGNPQHFSMMRKISNKENS